MHANTGAPNVGHRDVKTNQVPREGAGVVFDGRFSDRRPGIVTLEDVYARPLSHSLPSRLLEQPQEGRLVDVPKGITVYWEDQ